MNHILHEIRKQWCSSGDLLDKLCGELFANELVKEDRKVLLSTRTTEHIKAKDKVWIWALVHFKKLPSLIPSHGLWEGIIATRIYDIKKMLKMMEMKEMMRNALLNIWTNTYLSLSKGY
jgi:hypothetical protein